MRAGLARTDHGAGVIWVLALSSVLMVVAAGGAQIFDLLAARQRAAASADLGALAAAPAAFHGDDNACRVAAWVIAENGATLQTCRVDAGEVWITAASRPRSRLARWVSDRVLGDAGVRAAAHAGVR